KEALALARSYIGPKGKDAALVAALLDQLGWFDAAEEMYKKHLADSSRPESLLLFIKFLLDQKRLKEALDQCERAWDVCQLKDAAGITGYVLSMAQAVGQATDEYYTRAHGWVDLALRRNPKAVELLVLRAVLLEQQAKYPEAEKIYREILQADPKN